MALEIINRTPEQVAAWLEFYGYRSILDMQHGYALPPTGVFDEETAKAMEAPRCGIRAEMRAADATAKWNKKHLTIRVAKVLPGFTREEHEGIALKAARSWSEVCGLTFDLVSTGGDIIISHERIDGPGRTLAYAYFPSGGRPLDNVDDNSERWHQDVNLEAVTSHELGHNLGIDHDPDGQGLMAAFYNARIRKPQPGYDTRQAQSRYGPPTVAPPIDPPPPTSDEVVIRVRGTPKIDGHTVIKNR